MAAVLACGRSAAVSHLSAAALWRSVPGPDPADDVDVVIPCALRRARTGIRVHRVRGLRPDEVTTLEGIPLTTPGRTLVDLAGTVSQGELERALAETFARRLTSRRRLEALLARHAGRRGTSRLRALLGSGAEPAWTRSDAEGALLRLIGKAQLPLPEVNVVVGGFEVDFYWRRHRLVAELDGFAFHSSRRSFESDRRRDATLLAAGLRVMRVTWHQLQDEPEALLVLLARALTSAEPGSGALGPPRGPSRRRTRRDTPT
jgi:very-short-patch-repair endonuclease